MARLCCSGQNVQTQCHLWMLLRACREWVLGPTIQHYRALDPRCGLLGQLLSVSCWNHKAAAVHWDRAMHLV
jgi:hypothetical protein